MNNFEFTINEFSGPLDLLLKLVKDSKMDIYEVPIDMIIKQYIDFINTMEKLNIELASEYLVMASDLVHLKSKMLINENINNEESSEDEINSEEDLRKRLIEYKQYKDITESFKVLEDKRGEVYTKIPESLEEYKEEVILNTDSTLDDLMNAFNEFLKRQKYMKPLDTKITEREFSVKKRSLEIKNILLKHKKMEFFELFDRVNKPYIVVTFLSVLEMVKAQEISIKQDKNFDNIILEMK